MVEFSSGIWLYTTAALAIAIVSLFYLRIFRMLKKELTMVIASLILGLVIFVIEGVSSPIILALEIGILAFNGLLSGRTSKQRNMYVSISLLYIALIHWVGFSYISQALLIGMLSGITNIHEYKNSIVNFRVEVERDIFHIFAGIALMLIFYFETYSVSITVLILVILAGMFTITVTEIYKDRKASGLIYRLERNGSSLGNGALWLALGSLIAVSFLNKSGILVVFSAIFIGDPIATIIGVNFGKKKLPYNRSKSVYGTIAYFIATSSISYFFIGLYAIPVGIIAAIIESLKLKLDDNFTVPLILVLILNAFGL